LQRWHWIAKHTCAVQGLTGFVVARVACVVAQDLIAATGTVAGGVGGIRHAVHARCGVALRHWHQILSHFYLNCVRATTVNLVAFAILLSILSNHNAQANFYTPMLFSSGSLLWNSSI
jgi:hypothetical protein